VLIRIPIDRSILLKCLGWEKTLWFSQIHVPFPEILETRPKIANPRLANLSKTSLWKELVVAIDGVLDRCYKSFIEKNRKEPWKKVERNQFERVTDQIGMYGV
jgi:hypothetical protein